MEEAGVAGLAEDDGAAAVEQGAVPGVPAHGARRPAVQLACSPPPAPGKQAAGYRCDQPPVLLSQTFAASKFCSVLMYTALCTYDACDMSCSGEVIG
jgi:hypothetical protein